MIGGVNVNNQVILTISIMILYLSITIGIGWYTAKTNKVVTISDIFTSSRSLGILALVMAIFGSQITAFGILGAPGVAYNYGYSSFGYLAGAGMASALGFYIFGNRAWLLSHKFDYVTPVQFFKDRFNDNSARYVIAFWQIFLMTPYILICGIGAGSIIMTMTNGVVPYWLGALLILLICTWTAYVGGMKGTAYTNIFQGILLFVVLVFMMFFVYQSLGGGVKITAQLPKEMISLGGEAIQKPGMWIFYSMLATGLSNGVFGHLLIRNMSASHPRIIQRNVKIYPILTGLFFFMALALGVWGKVAVPNLDGVAVENIVPILAQKFAPAWMVGVLGAGILAAIMSSWDGMILTMSSIFSEDIYKPLFFNKKNQKYSNTQEKNISKLFIIIISVVIYFLVLWKPSSILKIATFSFAGMSTLTPAYFGCFYWKRATKWGIITSATIGPTLCALWALGILPESTTFGLFYATPALFIAIIFLVITSLLTKPAPEKHVKNFFSAFEDVYLDYNKTNEFQIRNS